MRAYVRARSAILIVALGAVLFVQQPTISRATAENEVAHATCARLREMQSYGLMPSGTHVPAGRAGSALIQEFAAPGGTTLGSITLPDGFNPATASNATLATFHLPARPVDPAAVTEWLATYGHPLHERPIRTAPCLTNDAMVSSATSSNWGGRVVTTSGVTDVVGQWTQPNFVFYCLHASIRSIWDGIGGWGTGNGNKLIQAGSLTSGSGINDAVMWVEVWNLEATITVSSPAISTGQVMKVETHYSSSSSGTATWTMTNRTTGEAHGWYQTGVSGYYDPTHAEWVDERSKNLSTGQLYLLRKSTNITYWGGEYVNGTQANSLPTTNVTMKDTDTLMTTVIGATTTSSETWKDCGPSSGTNQ